MSIDWHLLASTFALIFVAELPDKTAFATLVMATREHPAAVFAGVALAFLVQTIVAVFAGRLFSLLPEHWVHVASGILFLIFAVMTWRRKEEDEEKEGRKAGGIPEREPFLRTILSSFVVIFIAEWGDLTQLATATLVAKYEKAVLTIFLASVLGLWSSTAVVVVIGNRASRWINPGLLQKIAAVAFAAVGAYILYKG
jgi:putative Ca2+/H+ antiporter (TMEM165/GDT1 family)